MAWLDKDGEIFNYKETTGEYIEAGYFYSASDEPEATALSVEEEEKVEEPKTTK